jgi:hypothetical protein
VYFGLGVALALGVQLISTSAPGEVVKEVAPYPTTTQPRLEKTVTGQKGPWGVLEHERVLLQNYNQLVGDEPIQLGKPRWVFEKYSTEQLKELLSSCELTEKERSYLLDTSHWRAIPGGFVIVPPNDLVMGLGKMARQRLYPILAQNPANHAQSHPFRFPLDGFGERFEDAGLRPETVELLRQQAYTNAGSLCLCIEEPLQEALTTNEFKVLFRSFCTSRTWRLGVRIGPDSDIDALVKYWGRGGRERAIRPLLESLALSSKPQCVNISFFLPSFARVRLYTYPDPARDTGAMQQDCFYTALNFFSEQPDQALANGENATKMLLANFEPCNDPPVFGDLLVAIDPSNVAVHICVYVAEDFVFTKNGTGFEHPWVLMKIRDMMADYPSNPPLQLKHLRQKAT